MAAPDPGAVFPVIEDHGEGLGIVDDDHVVAVQVVSNGIFMDDALVDILFQVAQVDLFPLEGVVHFFGYAEKIRRSLNDPPPGLDPRAVHEKGQGAQELRHPAPVVGGVYMGDMQMPEGVRFPLDAFDCLRSDQRFIVFESCDCVRAHERSSRIRIDYAGRAPAFGRYSAIILIVAAASMRQTASLKITNQRRKQNGSGTVSPGRICCIFASP